MYGLVYKITNTLNGKVYIGQTVRKLKIRMNDHYAAANKKRKTAISHAISKYGKTAFAVEQIDQALTKDELDKKEIYWMDFYRSQQKKCGYNIKDGGSAGRQPKHIREAVAAKNRGRKLSPEQVALLKDRKGEKNPNYKNHFSHTAEAKQKMSEIKKGKRLRSASPSAKPIRCLETGQIFLCSMDAAEYFNVSKSQVCNQLKGRRESCKGMHFEFSSHL